MITLPHEKRGRAFEVTRSSYLETSLPIDEFSLKLAADSEIDLTNQTTDLDLANYSLFDL